MNKAKLLEFVYYTKLFLVHHLDVIYKAYIYVRARQIRKKQNIKVLFVLAELGTWKTEALYQAMLSHNRFNPIIGVTSSPRFDNAKTALVDYLTDKGYDYVDLDKSKKMINEINPDIILYYQPYMDVVPPEHVYIRHLKSLLLYVNYAFITMGDSPLIAPSMCNYSWLVFVENALVANAKKKSIGWRANNVRVTGIPMQDILIKPRDCFDNPWKDNAGRKRIIYAPHHSIPGSCNYCIEYSTFLELGEYMLEMAEKYKDSCFFAFKPHPLLYNKLLVAWGGQRTDDYYNRWANLENSQYSPGEYSGLFMHSDAMIHDCSSFQVEYLYTKNPVMFLDAASYKADELNEFGRMAHNMHYIGRCKQDIEDFIQNVINGKDPMKEERERFYNEYLLPPNNKTASENIIETILGQ